MSTGAGCFEWLGQSHYTLGGYKLLLGQPNGRVGDFGKESGISAKNLVKKLAF